MRIGDWSSDVCSSDLSIKDPGQFLFDPNSAQLGAVAVAQGGRQAAWFVQGEFGRGVLRRYRRGGLMAKVSVDRYVWGGVGATRSFAEFELLRFMHDSGLPVPRPLEIGRAHVGTPVTNAHLVCR